STAISASTPCWSCRGACRATSRQRSTQREAPDLRGAQGMEEALDLAADRVRNSAEAARHGLHGRGLLPRLLGDLADARHLARAPPASPAVSAVRLEAASALRAISWVAPPCSVTAAAMVVVMSPTSRMVRWMVAMASTARTVAFCMPLMCELISSVALAVWP